MRPDIELLTDDGFDLQFGTNVLGHFYLTKLLLPVLFSTALSSPDGTVRVVNTSSSGHWFGGLDFDTFRDSPKRRARRREALYGQSKTVRFGTYMSPSLRMRANRATSSSRKSFTADIVIKGSSPLR